MIPEAAVEAAVEAAKNFFDGNPPRGTRAALRLALEAAAPHMLRDAEVRKQTAIDDSWRDGYKAGQSDAFRRSTP